MIQFPRKGDNCNVEKIKEIINPPREEKGQGVVEYALAIGFAAIIGVALFAKGGLRDSISNDFGAVSGQLDTIEDTLFDGLTKIDGIQRIKDAGGASMTGGDEDN